MVQKGYYTYWSWKKTNKPVVQKGYYTCWSWTKKNKPVVQKGYYTCWSWTKTDKPILMYTAAKLRVGCMPNYKPSSYRYNIIWKLSR